MAQLIGLGRLGNAVKVLPNQSIDFPATALINPGIQDNFTASITTAVLSKDGDGAFRFLSRSLPVNANAFNFQIDWFGNELYFLIRNFNSANGDIFIGKTVACPESLILGRQCVFTFIKYNANPASSVSAAEWSILLDGVPLTQSFVYTNANITPATDIKGIYAYRLNYGANRSLQTSQVIAGFKYFNRALSLSEAVLFGQKEGKLRLPGQLINCDFYSKNRLTALDESGNNLHGTLNGFTNAQTASAGQPQSGNTAWVKAYSQAPIIA